VSLTCGHPDRNGPLAELGLSLCALDRREEGDLLLKKALKDQNSGFDMQRECLNAIGWDRFLNSKFKAALKWFKRARWIASPSEPPVDFDRLDGEDPICKPYRPAMENMLLALARLGRRNEAGIQLRRYHRFFGRQPDELTLALVKIGLDAHEMFIHMCSRDLPETRAD
jgi:hypothetical protein